MEVSLLSQKQRNNVVVENLLVLHSVSMCMYRGVLFQRMRSDPFRQGKRFTSVLAPPDAQLFMGGVQPGGGLFNSSLR